MPSVTRKSMSRRDDRREQVQQDLLVAIDKLLRDGESYTELSVERMVAEVGISRTTFYVYFADKGDLLASLSDAVIVDLLEASKTWFELDHPSRDDLRDALVAIARTYANHGMLVSAISETASYDPAVRESFHGMIVEAQTLLTNHLRRGRKDGFVAADVDPARTSAWVSWMMDRGFASLMREADGREQGRLIESLADILWKAIYRTEST